MTAGVRDEIHSVYRGRRTDSAIVAASGRVRVGDHAGVIEKKRAEAERGR